MGRPLPRVEAGRPTAAYGVIDSETYRLVLRRLRSYLDTHTLLQSVGVQSLPRVEAGRPAAALEVIAPKTYRLVLRRLCNGVSSALTRA